MSSVQKQLDKALADVSKLQEQVSTGQQEVSNLRIQLDSERAKVSNLTIQLDIPKVSSVQSEGVQLDTSKTGQDGLENAIAEQIRVLLSQEPRLSARAIAARIGCSPTTASTWKKAIEQELSVVPRLHVVNE